MIMRMYNERFHYRDLLYPKWVFVAYTESGYNYDSIKFILKAICGPSDTL